MTSKRTKGNGRATEANPHKHWLVAGWFDGCNGSATEERRIKGRKKSIYIQYFTLQIKT